MGESTLQRPTRLTRGVSGNRADQAASSRTHPRASSPFLRTEVVKIHVFKDGLISRERVWKLTKPRHVRGPPRAQLSKETIKRGGPEGQSKVGFRKTVRVTACHNPKILKINFKPEPINIVVRHTGIVVSCSFCNQKWNFNEICGSFAKFANAPQLSLHFEEKPKAWGNALSWVVFNDI